MTEKKIPLPEAPASLNFRGITQNGWDVQFTLRDSSEDDLLTRFGKLINKLEANYKVVPKGKQPNGNGSANTPVGGSELPSEDPGWCQLHNVGMKQRKNETGEWFSHKYGDGWCNGKEA